MQSYLVFHARNKGGQYVAHQGRQERLFSPEQIADLVQGPSCSPMLLRVKNQFLPIYPCGNLATVLAALFDLEEAERTRRIYVGAETPVVELIDLKHIRIRDYVTTRIVSGEIEVEHLGQVQELIDRSGTIEFGKYRFMFKNPVSDIGVEVDPPDVQLLGNVCGLRLLDVDTTNSMETIGKCAGKLMALVAKRPTERPGRNRSSSDPPPPVQISLPPRRKVRRARPVSFMERTPASRRSEDPSATIEPPAVGRSRSSSAPPVLTHKGPAPTQQKTNTSTPSTEEQSLPIGSILIAAALIGVGAAAWKNRSRLEALCSR